MTYTVIMAMTRDTALFDRVTAAVADEAWTNAAAAATDFGATSRSSPVAGSGYLIWPVAADNEAAYASALASGNPAPGADLAVVTDQAILSAVQAHWPMDPAP